MKKAIFKTEINTMEALTNLLKKYSNNNTQKVYTASVNFQTVRIYEYDNKSSIPVDSQDARTMLEYFNGICFKNGKLQPPTLAWQRRKNEDSFRVR